MINSRFQSVAASLFSWRRPWMWLLVLFLSYLLVLCLAAPWFITSSLKKNAQALDIELEIERLVIDPFALSLTLDGLAVTHKDWPAPMGTKRIFADLEISSFWSGVWRLRVLDVTGLYGEFVRIDAATNNFTALLNNLSADKKAAETEADNSRWLIDSLSLNVDRLVIRDQTLASEFSTTLGPVDFHVTHLTSEPNQPGTQQLTLKTSDGLRLQWTGDVSIAPFSSRGHLELVGPVLQLASDYWQGQLDAVAKGNLSLSLDYALQSGASAGANQTAPLTVSLEHINAQLDDLLLRQHSTDKPLLAINQLKMNEGTVRWPQQEIQTESIAITGADLWLVLGADGTFNVNRIFSSGDDASAEPSSPWKASVPTLDADNLRVHWSDESLPTPANLVLESGKMAIKGFTSDGAQPITWSSSFSIAAGEIAAQGDIQLNPLQNLRTSFTLNQIPLPLLQPYVEQWAAVDLKEGLLNAQGKITSADAQPLIDASALKITADARMERLSLLEKSSQQQILSWSRVSVNRIIADMTSRTLNIGRIKLIQPFAHFAITPDGGNTLSRILPAEESQSDDAENVDGEFAYLIGKIDVEDASGYFSDATLPLPFSATMTHLEGTISTVDSTSKTPARVKLDGQVGNYGEVEIAGDIFPLQPKQATQLQLNFNNIDIADFSPYSVKFAGREIATGKMDLDLSYDIQRSLMKGQNNLVLHDFTLGKKVDQPGALDLPLDLAIALLKDKDGVIHVDMPVSGNIDSPQFQYGAVIKQTLTHLLTNVVAAPFRMLGKLVGASSKIDLGGVLFNAGDARISPAQTEKLMQLAQAMSKRPKLNLVITGAYSTLADTEPLRQAKFESHLREQLSKTLADANVGSKKYIRTLEQMYEEQKLTPSLDELKKSYTQASENDAETGSVDRLSYVQAVRQRLIALEVVDQAELIALGDARAQAIQTTLLGNQAIKPARIELRSANEIQPEKSGKLKLKLDVAVKNKNAKVK